MTTLKRTALTVLTIFIAVLCVCIVAFWAPDLSRDELVEEYANEASQFFVTKQGDTVHFRDQGNEENPVLVLIHGTAASLHTWEPLIAKLGGQFRFISLDLPGHGLTGEFKQRDYSRKVMVDTIIELMDDLKIQKSTLVGNSLGGGIAWQAALAYPDRVNALALIAPSGAKRESVASSNLGFRILNTAIGRAMMKKLTPRFVIERSLKETVVDPDLISASMVDRYWRLLRMRGNRQAIIDLRSSDRNEQAFNDLDKLMAPTLIVWGQEDPILPVDMIRQFTERLPTHKEVVLTNIGHLPQEEAVDILSDIFIGFCRSYEC